MYKTRASQRERGRKRGEESRKEDRPITKGAQRQQDREGGEMDDGNLQG